MKILVSIYCSRIISIFIFLLFTPQILFSQIDTTLKDYFPMHVGDRWEYQSAGDIQGSFVLNLMKVNGDTVMPNGKSYRIFGWSEIYPVNQPEYNLFRRLDDSMRIREYRGMVSSCLDSGDIVLYDLRVKDSTLWPVCQDVTPWHYRALVLTDTEYYSGINLTLETKHFTYAYIDTIQHDTTWWPITSSMDYLARGIGLARSWGEFQQPTLTGAFINGIQYGVLSAVGDYQTRLTLPAKTQLSQNYPNPFNPTTIIHYDLPKTVHVRLTISDVLGREMATLVNELQQPGSKSVEFNSTALPSGVYFYRIVAGDFIQTKKMVLMK